MDELLWDHVKRLREIEDRLHRIRFPLPTDSRETSRAIADLHSEVKLMIERAEADYAAF